MGPIQRCMVENKIYLFYSCLSVFFVHKSDIYLLYKINLKGMNLKALRTYLMVSVLFFSTQIVQGKNYNGDTLVVLKPATKHAKETYLVNNLLGKNHYRKIELNDSLSRVIYKNYLGSLDNSKAYFLKSDIEYFNKYELQLDDDLRRGNLDVAFQIFRMFRERSNSRLDYVFDIIDNGFDFDKNEAISADNDDETWAETNDEVKERWRKIIKSQALSLKLADKEEEDIKETLTKRYKRYRKGINQYNSDDVFQFFMNAYTESFDPHTNYFSPISSENFKINMSLSLEGIGARLTQRLDYTMVDEVIAGGPAFKSKGIHKNDKIVAVAQGDEEDFVDVIGWRLQDVVQLIRGPKGSIVRLQLLKDDSPANGAPEVLRLERDKVKLEEQSAKAEVVPITEAGQVFNLGVITIPSFYINFDDARNGVEDYKSTTRDVKKLLEDLNAKNVDGVLIDLRYNGGGSLKEAIDLTGLFIEDGPVVQVRNSNGSIDVNKDRDPAVQFDKPLAVLINRFSASASEIFAGAIQDYKRGVIVGETTFGKGTVQNLIGLNQLFPGDKDKMGQLKLTLAKFYRVTGSSTQNIGVTPDVEFPSAFSAADFGESSRPNALPWDKIPTSTFYPTNNISKEMIDKLGELYQDHLSEDPDLQELIVDIREAKKRREEENISLNYEERKKETEASEERKNNSNASLEASAGSYNPELIFSEDKGEELNEDPYLKEGLKLLAELVKSKVG